MTQAPERPRIAPLRRAPRPQLQGDRGAWLPALLLALRTTAVGLIAVELVVLLLWATAARSGAGTLDTLRLGLTFWAAAHHAGVRVGPVTVGVVPYGLTVLPATLLYAGSRTLLRADRRLEPLAFMPALAVCYGVVVTAVALAARGPLLRPVPAEAFLGGVVLALAASGAAALRVRGVPTQVLERAPAATVAVLAAAGRALAALLGAGLLLALVVIAAAHTDVVATAKALRPGSSGAVGLVLLDLLAVPHLTAYGASVLAGPGFGLGAHTSVSLAGAHLGAVPALPVLAALPRSGPFPPVLLVLLAVPVGCGVLGGLRALRGADTWRSEVARALATAGVAGCGAAVLGWLADGSAGPGRLTVSGPSPWQLGLAVAGEVAVGSLLVVGLRAWRRWRPRR